MTRTEKGANCARPQHTQDQIHDPFLLSGQQFLQMQSKDAGDLLVTSGGRLILTHQAGCPAASAIAQGAISLPVHLDQLSEMNASSIREAIDKPGQG